MLLREFLSECLMGYTSKIWSENLSHFILNAVSTINM